MSRVQSSALTLNTNITGAGGFTKTIAGTLTLNAASTDTGAPNVNAGQLTLTGTTQSAVNVAAGATLSGTGTTGALNSRGTIAPGNAIGTLTVAGPLTLAGGSASGFELSDWTGAAGTG